MNTKKNIIIGIMALSFQGAFSQFKTTIPLDKNVTTGKLKNGLTYYILHNEEPKDRASFYFVQNVGAILEDDNQNGLAHFLEHMAFNGTQNFEGKGIIDMLEKKGVRFGADINAYTAQDQTVYNLKASPYQLANRIYLIYYIRWSCRSRCYYNRPEQYQVYCFRNHPRMSNCHIPYFPFYIY